MSKNKKKNVFLVPRVYEVSDPDKHTKILMEDKLYSWEFHRLGHTSTPPMGKSSQRAHKQALKAMKNIDGFTFFIACTVDDEKKRLYFFWPEEGAIFFQNERVIYFPPVINRDITDWPTRGGEDAPTATMVEEWTTKKWEGFFRNCIARAAEDKIIKAHDTIDLFQKARFAVMSKP